MDYSKILQDIDVPYLPNDPLYSFNCDGSIQGNYLFVTGVGFDKDGNLIVGTSDGYFYKAEEMPYYLDKYEAKAIRDHTRIKIEAYRTIQDGNYRNLEFFMTGFFLEDEVSTINIDKNFVDYAIKKYSEYLVPGVVIKLEVIFPELDRDFCSYYVLDEDLSYSQVEFTVKTVPAD